MISITRDPLDPDAVTQAVQGVDDQAQVKIDRAAQRVEVDTDASREALGAAIAEEGYKVA